MSDSLNEPFSKKSAAVRVPDERISSSGMAAKYCRREEREITSYWAGCIDDARGANNRGPTAILARKSDETKGEGRVSESPGPVREDLRREEG